MIMTLSVRQPWAWFIANGHKPVENRTWATRYRGPLLIHASKEMGEKDYQEAITFIMDLDPDLAASRPYYSQYQRGGIVGMATLVDCVTSYDSPWFTGPIGWVLADAKPIEFLPCPGRLGLFEIPPSLMKIIEGNHANP